MSQSIPEFFPAFRIHAADGFQGAAVEQISLDQLGLGEVVPKIIALRVSKPAGIGTSHSAGMRA